MTISAEPINGKWSVKLTRGEASHTVLIDAKDEFDAISGAETLLGIWHRDWMRAKQKAGG